MWGLLERQLARKGGFGPKVSGKGLLANNFFSGFVSHRWSIPEYPRYKFKVVVP